MNVRAIWPGARSVGLGLALLIVPVAGLAQAPEIAVLLEYEPIVVLKGIQPAFELAYSVRTAHSEAEFADFFPAEAFNGVRANCGMRSLEGAVLTMAREVTWTDALMMPASPLAGLQPSSMQLLLGGQEPTAQEQEIIFRDLVFDAVDVFDGDVLQTPRVRLDLDFADRNVGWTLTVRVECFCEYQDPVSNNRLGTHTSSTIGDEPVTVSHSGPAAPFIVGNEQDGWGAWKARFETDTDPR